LNSLHSKEVAHALVSVIKEKAANVGERIRQVRILVSTTIGVVTKTGRLRRRTVYTLRSAPYTRTSPAQGAIAKLWTIEV